MLSFQVKEQHDFSFCVTQKKVSNLCFKLHEDEEMITELHFQVMQSFKTEKYIFSVLDEACGVSV